MLWNAGQKRTAREQRARMGELFIAARDAALEVGVATGQFKTVGGRRLPSYIQPGSDVQPLRTPAARDAALAKLGVMFPGMVRQGRPE